MLFTIYKITNKINQKIYIGKHQTKDLNDQYMGSGKYLKRSILKYGIDNFVKEIIFQFDNEEEMNAKEAELVTEEFCLREDTYNICLGGKGGFSYINSMGYNLYGFNGKTPNVKENFKQGIETKKYLKENDEEWNKKVSKNISTGIKKYYDNGGDNGFIGKKHSDETKEKIGSKSAKHQLGLGNSQFGTIWITNGIENKKIKKEELIPENWVKGRKK